MLNISWKSAQTDGCTDGLSLNKENLSNFYLPRKVYVKSLAQNRNPPSPPVWMSGCM